MSEEFRLPKTYVYHLLYVVLIPAFFISFAFVYDPFGLRDFYAVGGKSYAFHFLMLTCILIVLLALTRLIFSLLQRSIKFLWWHYAIWCAGEVIVYSFFAALYTTLFYGGALPYFLALSHCLRSSFLILSYPYLFLVLVRVIANLRQDIATRSQYANDGLAKFYDEHHRLKLSIASSSLLFVNSEANYIKIHYEEKGRVKEFLLRNSMKSLERDAQEHGLVRCHRSYYVNPKCVKLLSRGRDGIITAELSCEGVDPLPVGKSYYDALAERL